MADRFKRRVGRREASGGYEREVSEMLEEAGLIVFTGSTRYGYAALPR